MKSTLLALSLCAASLLATASAARAESFDITKIETATVADLDAAKADADAHGDVFASQCYTGASAYIAAHPLSAISLTPPAGVVSTFQDARDGVKFAQALKSQSGIPPELVTACGPLALDVQSDLGRAAADFTLLGIHF